MIAWLLKGFRKGAQAHHRPQTVGDLRRALEACNPTSRLVVLRNKPHTNPKEVADRADVIVFQPVRLALPGEPNYVEGLQNRIADMSVEKRVCLRIYRVSRPYDDVPPVTAQTLLYKLENVPDEFLLVDFRDGDETRSPVAHSLTIEEKPVIETMSTNDPNYVRGNKVYAAYKHLSIRFEE